MQALGGRHSKCLVLGIVKVSTELDDLRAEPGDGGILVGGTPVRAAANAMDWP
jgi:hypothetical protein